MSPEMQQMMQQSLASGMWPGYGAAVPQAQPAVALGAAAPVDGTAVETAADGASLSLVSTVPAEGADAEAAAAPAYAAAAADAPPPPPPDDTDAPPPPSDDAPAEPAAEEAALPLV